MTCNRHADIHLASAGRRRIAEEVTTQALSCGDTHTKLTFHDVPCELPNGQPGIHQTCTEDWYVDREWWPPPEGNTCRVVDSGVNRYCSPCVRLDLTPL